MLPQCCGVKIGPARGEIWPVFQLVGPVSKCILMKIFNCGRMARKGRFVRQPLTFIRKVEFAENESELLLHL